MMRACTILLASLLLPACSGPPGGGLAPPLPQLEEVSAAGVESLEAAAVRLRLVEFWATW